VLNLNGLARDSAGHLIAVGTVSENLTVDGVVIPHVGGPDVFYLALDQDGTLLHANVFPDGTPTGAWSVAAGPCDRFALAGGFAGNIDFGGGMLNSAGKSDAFVAVFEQDGTHLWSERWGDGETQVATSIAFEDGDLALAGYTTGTIDFGGNPMPIQGFWDLFVARLDGSDGSPVWTKTIYDQDGGVMGDARLAVGGGRVFLTNFASTGAFKSVDFGDGQGVQQGTFHLAALDYETGAAQWSRPFLSSNGGFLAAGNGDSVVMVGTMGNNINFGDGNVMVLGTDDVYAVKYNAADGALRWARPVTAPMRQQGWAVAVDPAGHVFAGGYLENSMNWGDGDLVSGGSRDGFVAKLLP
jgi:hypothetical protein